MWSAVSAISSCPPCQESVAVYCGGISYAYRVDDFPQAVPYSHEFSDVGKEKYDFNGAVLEGRPSLYEEKTSCQAGCPKNLKSTYGMETSFGLPTSGCSPATATMKQIKRRSPWGTARVQIMPDGTNIREQLFPNMVIRFPMVGKACDRQAVMYAM